MSGGPPVATPRPPAGVVDVWRAELDDPGWDSVEGLSPRDRERAERLRAGETRKRWRAARVALRTVLARYLDDVATEAVEFVVGPHGKPSLPGPGPIRFNLSHSGAVALIAVAAEVEVGVDVELLDRGRDIDALIPHALDAEVGAAVLASPPAERAEAFHRAWVRREAIAKCDGRGLGDGPPAAPISVSSIELGDDYAAALAVAASVPARLRVFALTPPGGTCVYPLSA
jgi:4'-phosphopantetheinyl transferase